MHELILRILFIEFQIKLYNKFLGTFENNLQKTYVTLIYSDKYMYSMSMIHVQLYQTFS